MPNNKDLASGRIVVLGDEEIRVKPLTLKQLRKFVKVIKHLDADTTELSDEDISNMVEAASIALEKARPELAADKEALEEVVKDRDASRSPLFQVMLVLLNLPESSRLGVGEIELSQETIENKISKFEITFHVSQSVNGLSVLIAYNTDLYREDTIIRMAGHFKQLLHSVVKEPAQTIDSLQMLTEAEEQQLLVEFN